MDNLFVTVIKILIFLMLIYASMRILFPILGKIKKVYLPEFVFFPLFFSLIFALWWFVFNSGISNEISDFYLYGDLK